MHTNRKVTGVARATSLLAVACLVLAVPHAAAGQDTEKNGLVVSSPGAVGVIWHLTDELAVRPMLSIAWLSIQSPGLAIELPGRTELTNPPQSSLALSIDIAVLWSIAQWGQTRAYLAPSFSRDFSSSPQPGLGALTDDNNFQVGGAFGIRHTLSDRFAVFGETGLRYSYSSSEISIPLFPSINTKSVYKAVGTASRLGVSFGF